MPDEPDPPQPDAPATDEESAKAEELRAALEGPGRHGDGTDWVRALAAAWSPRDLPREAHRAILDQALAQMKAPRPHLRARRAWYAAVVALAAGLCLTLGLGRRPAPSAGRESNLAVRRSTQPLFTARFPAFGGETARIDRIAMTRSSDLRDNEFTRWRAR